MSINPAVDQYQVTKNTTEPSSSEIQDRMDENVHMKVPTSINMDVSASPVLEQALTGEDIEGLMQRK